MLVFGIEMELLTLISLSVMAVTIVIWLLREWSWYSFQYKAQQTISTLREANDNLFLRLQIEEAAQPQCPTNTTMDLSASNSTVSFSSTLSSELLYPAAVFFDLSGFAQLAIFTSIILLEYNYLHFPHLSLAGDNPTEQGIKRELQDFLLKKHPVTNILVFSAIAMLSVLAWWNILPRTTFLDICFKVVLALAISSPIAYVTHNLLRIKQYFPKDKQAWEAAVKDYTWWIWLFSRLIGAYDLKSASKTAIWLFCVLWYAWPVRYFFYYRFVSCSPSEPQTCSPAGTTDGSGGIGGNIGNIWIFQAGSAGNIPTYCGVVDTLFASNNVFYVNMLGQGALLMVCCNVAYLLTMLKAVNVRSKSAETGLGSAYTKGMGIDSAQYGIIGAILRRIDNANGVALLALFSLCNSVLAILRVCWWCVFGTCTWYAALVATMFIQTHIGVTMYALPSINALMQKYSTIDAYRAPFVEQFQQHQRELRKEHTAAAAGGGSGGSGAAEGSERSRQKGSLDPTAPSQDAEQTGRQQQEGDGGGGGGGSGDAETAADSDDNDSTAQDIFNKVLTDAVLFYLFVSVKSSDEKTSTGTGEKENPESKLSVIFQAFLQTAAFSYQQTASQDEGTADGGNDDGGQEEEPSTREGWSHSKMD